MGQKTHPKGFRLITTQKHLSDWYSKKENYSSFLQEDALLREKIEKTFSDFLVTSNIEISRVNPEGETKSFILVTIDALYPRSKDMYRKVTQYFTDFEKKEVEKRPNLLKNLKGNLKKYTGFILKRKIRNLVRFFQLKTEKEISIRIRFIRNRFEDSILIAKYIAEQLEKRIPFRRAVKQTIKKVKLTSIKGIKIEVSGRLNGIEIARSEWKREGKIPLHTLKATIDYVHQRAETIYGVIGIKVWLYKN